VEEIKMKEIRKREKRREGGSGGRGFSHGWYFHPRLKGEH
jgi:hypothetical protein